MQAIRDEIENRALVQDLDRDRYNTETIVKSIHELQEQMLDLSCFTRPKKELIRKLSAVMSENPLQPTPPEPPTPEVGSTFGRSLSASSANIRASSALREKKNQVSAQWLLLCTEPRGKCLPFHSAVQSNSSSLLTCFVHILTQSFCRRQQNQGAVRVSRAAA